MMQTIKKRWKKYFSPETSFFHRGSLNDAGRMIENGGLDLAHGPPVLHAWSRRLTEIFSSFCVCCTEITTLFIWTEYRVMNSFWWRAPTGIDGFGWRHTMLAKRNHCQLLNPRLSRSLSCWFGVDILLLYCHVSNIFCMLLIVFNILYIRKFSFKFGNIVIR